MPWKQTSVEKQRHELVLAVLRRRETVGKICRRFKVSRQSAYKFVRRFMREGLAGLKDRARGRRPLQRWRELRTWVLDKRRRRPTWGADKLWWSLRQSYPRCRLPSVRTVERWLREAGQTRKPKKRLRYEPKKLQPPRRGRRANDVWTIDWKGWVRTGDAAKIEPLTVRDLGSRYGLWGLPLSQRSDAAVRRRCTRLFRQHGTPRTIRTDLGGPFCGPGPYGLTTLSLWWYRLGIGVEFVRRGQGLHNNEHEQMHRVMQAETANPPAATKQAQLRRLRRWLHHYNYQRPHAALGQRTPAEVDRSKPAPLPALLVPTYPPHWPVRRVSRTGDICLGGRRWYIGRAFAGQSVGCCPRKLGHRVYFARLLLATLSPPKPN
jgi:putative transposase